MVAGKCLHPHHLQNWVWGYWGQVKVLAAKPDTLSSFPGTHMVEGENRLPQVASNLLKQIEDKNI